MTYKQIEASREARLWIGQVIIPAVAAAGIVLSNPETRRIASTKFNNVKSAIKNKFKKDN